MFIMDGRGGESPPPLDLQVGGNLPGGRNLPPFGTVRGGRNPPGEDFPPP